MRATIVTKPRTTAPVSVRAAAILAKAPKTTADEYAKNDLTGKLGTLIMRCAIAFLGQTIGATVANATLVLNMVQCLCVSFNSAFFELMGRDRHVVQNCLVDENDPV
jgi:hypothetical protein